MKKVSFLILFSLLTLTGIQAQQKEFALTTSGLNSFGFSIRIGSATGLWRINSISSNTASSFRVQNDIERRESQFSTGLSGGYEWRKPVDDKLHFRYGLDASLGYSFQKTTLVDTQPDPEPEITTQSSSLVPGINLVLGLNYPLSERFLVGVETLPGLQYRIYPSNNSGNDRNDFNTQLSLNSVLVSIAYVLK